MLTRQQRWTRRIACQLLFAGALVLLPWSAFAQDQGQDQGPGQGRSSSFLTEVAKRVLFDPTTYAPAIVAYDVTLRDWKSSQPFFQDGFVEHNSRFTISGRPDDVAVSYGVGTRRILLDAVANLEISAVHNLADSVIERVLIERYPNHRKLFRAIGWVEKVSFAGYLSYRLSAAHYSQWQQNEQTARRLGMR